MRLLADNGGNNRAESVAAVREVAREPPAAFTRLDEAALIAGPHREPVGPRCGLPVERPPGPNLGTLILNQPGVLLFAAVDTHLHGCDTPQAGEGNAGKRKRTGSQATTLPPVPVFLC